jgi:tRNA 2-thiouridine synthesizing protein A
MKTAAEIMDVEVPAVSPDADARSAIELLATDAGSVKDVAAWCRTTGNILVEQTSDGAVYRFVIRRK